jgi:hypothetical protein
MCLSKNCGCTCTCHEESSYTKSCGHNNAQPSHGSGASQDIHNILFKKLCCLQKKIEGLEEKLDAVGFRLYEEIEAVGEKIDDLTQE